MLKFNKVFCSGLLFTASALSAFAQQINKPLKIEVPPIYTANTTGDIRCYISQSAIGKSKPVVRFFAQNNQRGMPMRLLYKRTELPVRLLALARNSSYRLAFRADINEVLYQTQGSYLYSWTWRGRAKAPASPLVSIPGEKVETIKWWATVTIGTKTYTSDTLTTTIQ